MSYKSQIAEYVKNISEEIKLLRSGIMKKIRPFIGLLIKLNSHLKLITNYISPLIPNIIIVLLGAYLLLASVPGKDVVANIGYSPLRIRFFFHLSVFSTALMAWFWSRQVVSQKTVAARINKRAQEIHKFKDAFFKDDAAQNETSESTYETSRTYQFILPFILGMVPLLSTIISLFFLRKDFEPFLSTWVWIIILFVAYILITLWEWLYSSQQSEKTAASTVSKFMRQKNIFTNGALANLFGFITLVSIPFVLGTLLISPYGFPAYIGPGGMAFWAFALMIPLFSMTIIFSFIWRLPLIRIMFALLVLNSSFIIGGDFSHEVRRPSDDKINTKRLSIASGVEYWLKRQSSQLEPCSSSPTHPIELEDVNVPQPAHCLPIVFVSITGGASRAAYFSQAVLGALEEKTSGEFHKRVFTITAVSGGALGAVSYSGMLDVISKCPDFKKGYHETVYLDNCSGANAFSEQLSEFNGKDYLSTAISGLLYTDLVEDFVPIPRHFTSFLGYKDRAAGLEVAFEKGWSDTIGIASNAQFEKQLIQRGAPVPFQFSRSFTELFQISENIDLEWRPALMLIGAHQESGKRIITGHLKPPISADILDFHELFGGDVKASTAVMNSARFPIISPPGLIYSQKEDGQHEYKGHIMDGGYFEGDGIETTVDIYEDVLAAFQILQQDQIDKMNQGKNSDKTDKRKGLKIGDVDIRNIRLQPIFIEINSNDTLSEEDMKRCISEANKQAACRLPTLQPENEHSQILNELFGPLDGLLSTRTGRGVMGAKRLSEQVFQDQADELISNPEYYQFRLCKNGNRPTAVSWALSEPSKFYIDRIFHKKALNVPKFLKDLNKVPSANPDPGSCVEENRETLDSVSFKLN